MQAAENFIKFVPELFKVTLNEDNFEEIVFNVLNKIFSIESAYIFFINSEDLTLRFSYNSKFSKKVVSIEEFNPNEYMIADLCVEGIPFGKLILQCDFIDKKKVVFQAAAAIVSNLVKDLEINSILKMQVEALQDGMNEVTRANELIKKQNKKILSAEKAKSDFFANVSHQLRSPLNSIIGFTDILGSEFVGSLNDKQKDYISDIKISGIKLLEMVNEVLDISKIESKSMVLFKRTFEPETNIQEVLNILKPLYIQKNITVNLLIQEKIEVFADYQKIQQVFFNLISNAIKFTPHGGLINVSAEIKDSFVEISVKDNGIGIDKKFHKQIFKKYRQAGAQDSSSTGLGLTIVQEIINLHGGHLTLNSALGQGAEFVVSLPRC